MMVDEPRIFGFKKLSETLLLFCDIFVTLLQGFLNCAAPLRLGVMALAICFDSSPKKFYVSYLHRIFRILGLCSKNNSIFSQETGCCDSPKLLMLHFLVLNERQEHYLYALL